MAVVSTVSPNATDELTALLGAFNDVLQEERSALGAHDSERLAAVVERKSALVVELEAAIARHCPPGQQPPPQWREISRLAGACAEANRVNGGAIMLNRSLVSGLLDIAQGGRPGTSTYTAAGRLRQRATSLGVGYV